MHPRAKKTVVIVEDDRELQKQLISLIGETEDITCLYAVSSGEEALTRIPSRPPDVVLMDINLPGISGIECVTELKERIPTLEIVMLTIYEDSDNLFRALRAGASGYLIKSSAPEELFESIRNVSIGGAPFSSHLARKVVRHFQDAGRTERGESGLTHREIEVLDLLCGGYVYKEIADRLGIHPETVRSYVKTICLKMHVRNRLEAVAKYRG